MNCRSCGAPLPAGTGYCTSCGATVTPTGSGQNTPSSPYAPTVAAQPYGAPQGSNYDPTVFAQPYNAQQTPQGNQPSNPYGSTPQGQGAYTAYDPYSAAASAAPPPNPYGTPPPSAPYGAQAPVPGAGYYPQAGVYGSPMPVRKKSNAGLIITLVVLAVVVIGGGGIWMVSALNKTNTPARTTTSGTPGAASTTAPTNDATPTAAPTTAPNSDVPAQSEINPTAAAFFTNVKTTSAIDDNYNPTQPTNTFQANKFVYVTFDIKTPTDGYYYVRWFEEGREIDHDNLPHKAANDHGYFGLKYTDPGAGTLAIYWCTKADYSDKQLAALVNFTVTN